MPSIQNRQGFWLHAPAYSTPMRGPERMGQGPGWGGGSRRKGEVRKDHPYWAWETAKAWVSRAGPEVRSRTGWGGRAD